jgi:hypothetical protein
VPDFELAGFWRAYWSRVWPSTQGLIVESRVLRDVNMHRLPHSTLKIRYSYAVAGRRLENDTVAFGLCRGKMTWGYADRKAKAFPAGQAVEVFYNSDDPGIACLEPGGLGWEDPFMLLVAIAGLAFGMNELRKATRC